MSFLIPTSYAGGVVPPLQGSGDTLSGRLCEVIAQTEPASAIECTVYVRSEGFCEASSPSDVEKVCPTPAAACPEQMQQYLLGECCICLVNQRTRLHKNTAWMDYGVSPLPIRRSLVGRVAAGIG
eukprot:2428381-Amphidinium_carterae.1